MAKSSAENSTPAPIGRPWQPGQSGNPGGRPKGLAKRVRDAVEDGENIVSFLTTVLADQSESTRDRIAAAQILMERGWGKAPQLIDVEQTSEGLIVRLAFDPSENGNGSNGNHD